MGFSEAAVGGIGGVEGGAGKSQVVADEPHIAVAAGQFEQDWIIGLKIKLENWALCGRVLKQGVLNKQQS